jgi:hypothetical protein
MILCPPTRLAAALALAMLAAGPAATAPPAPRADAATAAFDQLKTLVGTWRNAERPDSPLRVRFSLTAGGTVLVESWERGTSPHSLTLYHRDGARLIATHYCPQGNQPRLAMQPLRGRLQFAFVDAADLAPGESHLRQLAFDLSNPQRPLRTESYRTAGKLEPSRLILERTPGGTE